MRNTALDDLLALPGESGDQYRTALEDPPLAGEVPEETFTRTERQNRIKAEDLKDRGIPSFRDAHNRVVPVTDDTGQALTGHDSRHNIAYDGAGQPKVINYSDETGPPALSDPFAGLPTRTDEKTGDQYRVRPGLPWDWVGKDETVAAKAHRREADKTLKQESSLLGRKLSLDEHDYIQGEKEHVALRKSLQQQVPSLLDPKYEGADLETVVTGINEHFNSEYGTGPANEKRRWFSSDLSDEATALRSGIDQRKAAAIDSATKLFALKESQAQLGDSVNQVRGQQRLATEQLLAHTEGREGPLDQPQDEIEALRNPEDRVPPVASIMEQVTAGEITPEQGQTQIKQAQEVRQIEKAKPVTVGRTLDEIAKDEVGVIKRLKQVWDKAEWAPYASSVVEAKDLLDIGLAARRLINADKTGQVGSREDAELVKTWLDRANQTETFGAKIVGLLAGSAAFGGEIAVAIGTLGTGVAGTTITRGGAKLAKEGLKNLIEKGTREVVERQVQKIIGKTGGEILGKTAGKLALAVPVTAIAAPLRITTEVIEKTLPIKMAKDDQDRMVAIANEDHNGFMETFGKAALDQYIEVASEFSGGIFKYVPQPKMIQALKATVLAKIGLAGQLGPLAEKLKEATTVAMEQAAWNGALAEVGEEYIGGIMRVMTGTPIDQAFPKTSDVPAMLAAFMVPGAAATIGTVAANRLQPKPPSPPAPPVPTAPVSPTSPTGGNLSEGSEIGGGEESGKTSRGISETQPREGEIRPGTSAAESALAVEPEKPVATATAERPADEKGGLRVLAPEGGVPHTPQTSGAHVVSTGVQDGGDIRVGAKWDEPHEGIGTRHGFAKVPEAVRGFVVQDEDGTQRFTSREEAASIAEKAGQIPGPLIQGARDNGLRSQDLQISTSATAHPTDVAAHEAATSPTNAVPEPTQPQKEAGKLQLSQPAGDGGSAHAKVFGDSSTAQALSEKGFDALPRDRQGVVLAKVRASLDHPEILKTIVESVPVDVMHGLVGEKITPEMLLHDKSVLTHRLSVTGDVPIPQPVVRFVHSLSTSLKGGLVGRTAEKSRLSTPTKTVGETSSAKSAVDEKRAVSHDEDISSTALLKQADNTPTGATRKSLVEKLVLGHMAGHVEQLEALGHGRVPRVGKVSEGNMAGLEAMPDDSPAGGTIVVDAEKLAEATKGMDERAKSRYIKAAIEEEVFHIATLKLAKQDPKFSGDLSSWGKEDDAIARELIGKRGQSWWDGQSEFNKGAEKLRFAAQKRPTELAASFFGKLGESAKAALKRFLQFIKELPGKLTERQREMVEQLRAVLGGEEAPTRAPPEPTAPKAEVTRPVEKPTPDIRKAKAFSAAEKERMAQKTELLGRLEEAVKEKTIRPAQEVIVRKLLEKSIPTPTQIEQAAQKFGATVQARSTNVQSSSDRQPSQTSSATPVSSSAQPIGTSTVDQAAHEVPKLTEEASTALDDALGGLFAAPPVQLTPKEKVIANQLRRGNTIEKIVKDYVVTRDQVESAYDKVIGAFKPKQGLAAPAPKIVQLEIPEDRLEGFVKAARAMIKAGMDTPEKMARILDEKYQQRARPFYQAIWDAVGMVKGSLRNPSVDWDKITGTRDVSPGEASPETPREHDVLADQVARRMLARKPLSRTELTALAKDVAPSLSVKEVDEAAEFGVVKAAREIVKSRKEAGTPEDAFDRLVELYDHQPNLTARTSTSKIAQAYSTPIPLAYLAAHIAGADKGVVSVYEPTAGNGALLIGSDSKKQTVYANELDPARAARLREQGFKVTTEDATTHRLLAPVTRIVANPPFGTLLEEGASRVFQLPNTSETTKDIAHQIMMNSLQDLEDDGRAVFIVGGKNIEDREERAKAYTNQPIWPLLYNNYRVVDHFTVSGDLYKKQGAGWPVDFIVVAGKGKSPIQLPSADGPRMLTSWSELKNELNRTDEDRIAAGKYDPERDRAKVGGIIDSIRGITGTEQSAGSIEHPKPAKTGDGTGGSGERPVSGTRVERTDRPVGSEGRAGGEVGRVGAESDLRQPEQRGYVDGGAFRVPYKPKSKLKSFGIFVPTNMEVPAREALEKLAEKVGDFDDFVRGKLKYPKDAPIDRYFSAEQMDALALAIDAIDSKTAFVLGDQGGVGKGRVAAGMIRYATKQDKIPIFLTKDEKLYKEMITDLADIGSPDIIPTFTNNDMKFSDETDKLWRTKDMKPVIEEVARTGKLPRGTHVLFSTYFQIQNDEPSGYNPSKAERASLKNAHEPPPDGHRMDALKKLAPNSIIIADESHLAAGDSIRAWRLAPILGNAAGVYYSSATFAKRPDSLGIYSQTSLSHATQSMDELVSAMRAGGQPLQQVVSAILAADGLYLRRERDMSGIEFRTHINVETKERDLKLADNYTSGIREILTISNKMKSATDLLNKILRKQGKSMRIDKAPKLESTNFASKLHNLISQYLFAIKAEAAVRRTVEHVAQGKKVVIAFQNTMEQPILDLERGGRPFTFNGLLLRYLDSQRVLKSGKAPNVVYTTISDKPNEGFADYTDKQLQNMLIGQVVTNDAGEQVGTVNEPALAELFRRMMATVYQETEKFLEEVDLADMPVSPIDYMRRKLSEAGIKNVEITGRGKGIDGEGKIYKVPGRGKNAQIEFFKQFNNSDVNAMLMNDSGSTGVSAHASEKFKRQDPRHMIIMQPHLDINSFMQTTWRIDRTGQVVKPSFELLQTAIPAELRPAAILGRKMGSLNANTTSNADNEVSEGNAGVDIMNQYGDEVVYDYLRNDPAFVQMLQMPKIMDGEILAPIEDVLGRYEQHGQLAAGVTGRAGVLLTDEQREFWNKVRTDYLARIAYLNEIGENDLVTDTLDIKAETLSSKELTPAKSGTSGFDAASNLERVKAVIGTKPLTSDEVIALAEEAGRNAHEIYQGWEENSNRWREKELQRMSEKMLSWDLDKAGHYEAKWRTQAEEVSAALGLLGNYVHVHTDKGLDAYGAVTAVHLDAEHPLTPSAQIFEVYVNTTKKMLRVPGSQLNSIAKPALGDFKGLYDSTAETSNERYIITGNLLAAYLQIMDNAPNAKIVQYTTDKGDLRQGILMPVKFTPGSLAAKKPVESPSHMRNLLEAGRALVNGDGAVTMVKKHSAERGDYVVLRVPTNKIMGGNFWRDSTLNALMDGGQFVERGGAMVGTFKMSGVPAVYQILLDKNTSLYYQDQPQALQAPLPKKIAEDYYKQDVAPVLQGVGLALKEGLGILRHLVSPTFGVNQDAVNHVMKMLGARYQQGYQTQQILQGYKGMFDRMSRAQQIDFVDRVKRGEQQVTPELEELAQTLRKIDTDSFIAAQHMYEALGFKEGKTPLSWLENHFRVLWKVIPKTSEGKAAWIGKSKGPLAGSKGMTKQHTLEDMSEGIALGGVPYSYNPIELFELAQADIWKLITALKMWKWAKDNGFVEFVRGPFPKAPDGMTWLNDSIANVYFMADSGEGLIEPGRFAVEEGVGRLLNNYLSRDMIRQTRIGRGLLWTKNATTTLELSLSLFHGIFESLEMIGSNIGLGLSKMANRPKEAFFEGILDIVKAVGTPITGNNLGVEIRKAAGNPEAYFKTEAGKKLLKVYPRAREMIDDLFSAGWKPTELEQDWKNKSIRTFVEAVGDIKAGSSSNYIGAFLRAFPAGNEFLMKPLFDYYIPNLKVAQFFREYDEALKSNERRLKGGVLTRAALARATWRLVEDRFGEMNFDTLLWNNTFKTAMQLMFRSVTWKLGSLEAFGGAFRGQAREFVSAFKEKRAPELHRNMAWLLGMLALTAALGTVISIALGKHEPEDLTDVVFPRIDKDDARVRVSLPTYFKDLVHLVHSPTGYVTASMSGWIGRVADLLRNKDYYGVQIRDSDDQVTKQALDMAKHTATSLLPFSIRGYKNLSQQQESTLKKSLALLGANPAPRYIGQSAAEHASEDYWRGQKTEAGISPEQMESKLAKRVIVSKIAHGQSPEIAGALASGAIKPRDVSALYKRAQIGPLASQVDHMPLEEAEKVYAKAGPAERRQLDAIMSRKRSGSFARGGRTMWKGF